MKIFFFTPLIFLMACDDISLSLKPYAERRHAEMAAKDCDIGEWQWKRAIYLHTLPDTFESFSYDLRPLPEERIELEESVAWDMSKRVQQTDACLNASFYRQGVKAKMHSASYRIGSSDPTTTTDEIIQLMK